MKNKVRKFSAGDIVTGLGAVLVGKALYDKYKSKNDEESDYARKVKEFRTSKEDTAKPAEESKTTKAEPKEETREDYLAKKVKPIKTTGTFAGSDTAEPDLEYKSKSVVKTTPKKAAPAAPAKPAAQSTVEGSTPKDKSGYAPAPRNVRSMIEGKGTSGAKGTQDVGKALGMSSNAKGTQTLGERIKGTAESAGKSVVRTPQQRMADAAREVEERRKKEREGMKRGGVVKSSASKRADGIAQRGKTRGRIC
jgi:hypothetical protein